MASAEFISLSSLVNRASGAAGCRAPSVHVRPMRNACYNPLLHKVSFSERLVHHLSPTDLHTLVAHEVGHATQRLDILRDGFRILGWPLLVLLIAGTLSVGAAASGNVMLAIVLGISGLGCVVPVERYTSRVWQESYLRREIEADAFANRFVGRSRATEDLLHACAQLEDHGELSPEGERRIAALPEPNAGPGCGC